MCIQQIHTLNIKLTWSPGVTAVTSDPDGCGDLDPDCATYGAAYICTADYHAWSSIHCAKFCNLCNNCTFQDYSVIKFS